MSTLQILQIPLAQSPSPVGVTGLLAPFRIAPGNLATLWAVQHEDNKILGIVVNWESVDSQKQWEASAAGIAAKTEIGKVATGPVYDDLVVFLEDSTTVLTAKVVELVSWIHPVAQIDEEKKKKVEYGFAQFQKAISSDAPEGDKGLVAGWGSEFNRDGVPSKRFTSLIGWKSVEAHYSCKETNVFKDNIHWLMEHDDTGVEMVHFPYSQSLE